VVYSRYGFSGFANAWFKLEGSLGSPEVCFASCLNESSVPLLSFTLV
jgi:hypothetical protein